MTRFYNEQSDIRVINKRVSRKDEELESIWSAADNYLIIGYLRNHYLITKLTTSPNSAITGHFLNKQYGIGM